MKTFIGFGLIVLALASLFRYPNFGRSLPESIGVLIGVSFFIVPGILLIRSDNKKSDDQK